MKRIPQLIASYYDMIITNNRFNYKYLIETAVVAQ